VEILSYLLVCLGAIFGGDRERCRIDALVAEIEDRFYAAVRVLYIIIPDFVDFFLDRT
jgi:hypothetical protein